MCASVSISRRREALSIPHRPLASRSVGCGAGRRGTHQGFLRRRRGYLARRSAGGARRIALAVSGTMSRRYRLAGAAIAAPGAEALAGPAWPAMARRWRATATATRRRAARQPLAGRAGRWPRLIRGARWRRGRWLPDRARSRGRDPERLGQFPQRLGDAFAQQHLDRFLVVPDAERRQRAF